MSELKKLDNTLGRVGDFLYFLGIGLFPFSLGIVGGFYMADQGARWLPTTIGWVLAGCMVALLLIITGRWLRGRLYVMTEHGLVLSRRLIVAVSLFAVALSGWLVVFALEVPAPLTELSPEEFETAWAIDSRRYEDTARSADRMLDRLDASPMFSEGDRVLTADEESELLGAWRTLYDLCFQLDHVRVFYEDWYRFDPSRAERSYHLRSFVLLHTSSLAQYDISTRFVDIIKRNADAEKLLDAPHPKLGFEANSLSLFRQDLHSADEVSRLAAAQRYRTFFGSAMSGRTEAQKYGAEGLWDEVEVRRSSINEVASLERGETVLRSDLQMLERPLKRSWYPAQKGVAEWFGDTRTRRIGWYLIGEEQVPTLVEELEPGDILLSRKNWYLSNIGLPGFWPHGLVYMGDVEEFDAAFDTPEVREWVLEESGVEQSLSEYLESRWPEGWARYAKGDDGHEHRVIEAISEGVVFNTLEHASGDYLAAMRPRLSQKAKAQAIVEGFEHLGKPYDFDFDFATDHALVCTELVFRMYRPAEGKDGIDFDIVEVAGRRTLPANILAEQFSRELGTDEQQLDFVWFYDARESTQSVVEADEAAFAASWERVKWDTAQE
ncbi:MAG: hypothetical protein GY913_16990 [Proteobacteria bacterium]|nr:hypothetical protein [Pseudomonadota bacterium]MCP4918601.1 hypothetical protein [Pseudomonadota bacterium]